MLNSVDTGSQVCNLAWCKNVNELVSTHGYSQNQIMVWKYHLCQRCRWRRGERRGGTRRRSRSRCWRRCTGAGCAPRTRRRSSASRRSSAGTAGSRGRTSSTGSRTTRPASARSRSAPRSSPSPPTPASTTRLIPHRCHLKPRRPRMERRRWKRRRVVMSRRAASDSAKRGVTADMAVKRPRRRWPSTMSLWSSSRCVRKGKLRCWHCCACAY